MDNIIFRARARAPFRENTERDARSAVAYRARGAHVHCSRRRCRRLYNVYTPYISSPYAHHRATRTSSRRCNSSSPAIFLKSLRRRRRQFNALKGGGAALYPPPVVGRAHSLGLCTTAAAPAAAVE